MRRFRMARSVFMLLAVFCLLGVGVARAQDATPEMPVATPEAVTDAKAPVELKLVDQSRNVNTVDYANDGLTPGDMIVWGPDPLYNADNMQDTGSVTYGSCVMVNTDGDCMAQETFIFADGSTIEVQGLEFGDTTPVGQNDRRRFGDLPGRDRHPDRYPGRIPQHLDQAHRILAGTERAGSVSS